MDYFLEQREGYFVIGNADSDCCVGYVDPHGALYNVENDDEDVIAVVRSPNDAISAIAAYYESNPPQWKRASATRYAKFTQFGGLRVEQRHPGQWLAFRNDLALLRNGQPAIFTSLEQAQHAADAHVREGYPNSATIFDGFAWLPDPDPWWSYPHRIALRDRPAA